MISFSWEDKERGTLLSYNHGLGESWCRWVGVKADGRTRFLPCSNPGMMWRARQARVVRAGSVCVLGFSCFPCVCFCCKLQTDVFSLATPDQLEVVIGCCKNCAFCKLLAPLGPFAVLQKWISPLAFTGVLRPLCFVFIINMI